MKKLNFFPTKKSTQFMFMLFFCITLILSVMTGCDDKNSSEAKLFEAKEALNDGQWVEARLILLSLNESEEVLQYLSNTYAGEVGINTFDLLTTIDELDGENDGSDNSGSIDMIGTLIGDENNALSVEDITEKLATINNAIDNLNLISSLTGTSLNNDQAVQLGLASMTRTVLIMAELIAIETGEPEVTMTEEWITNYRDSNGLVISDATWESDSYDEMLVDDITNVGNSVLAISGENDLKEDFDEFKAEIDNGNGEVADNGSISLSELNFYLDDM